MKKLLLISAVLFAAVIWHSCTTKADSLKVIRNNWEAYIYHEKINYTSSKIGGIRPFEVPIRNETDFIIDEVQVSIDYIKEAGGIFKTEKVTVYNIPPHTEKRVMAPESPRGTSIDASISSVFSRDLKFCFPGRGMDRTDVFACY